MDDEQRALLRLYIEYSDTLRELIRAAPSFAILRATEARLTNAFASAARPLLEIERLKSADITGPAN